MDAKSEGDMAARSEASMRLKSSSEQLYTGQRPPAAGGNFGSMAACARRTLERVRLRQPSLMYFRIDWSCSGLARSGADASVPVRTSNNASGFTSAFLIRSTVASVQACTPFAAYHWFRERDPGRPACVRARKAAESLAYYTFRRWFGPADSNTKSGQTPDRAWDAPEKGGSQETPLRRRGSASPRFRQNLNFSANWKLRCGSVPPNAVFEITPACAFGLAGFPRNESG